MFKHLLSTEHYFTSIFFWNFSPFQAIIWSHLLFQLSVLKVHKGKRSRVPVRAGLQGFEGSCLLWTAVWRASERVADTYSIPASFLTLPLLLALSPAYLPYWIQESEKTVLADLSACILLPTLVVITAGLPKQFSHLQATFCCIFNTPCRIPSLFKINSAAI